MKEKDVQEVKDLRDSLRKHQQRDIGSLLQECTDLQTKLDRSKTSLKEVQLDINKMMVRLNIKPLTCLGCETHIVHPYTLYYHI